MKMKLRVHPHKRRSARYLWLLLIPILLFWLSQVSRPGPTAQGCWQDCAPASPAGSEVRVLSLNMLHGFPHFRYLDRRLEIIANEIAARDADIVLLQEVPWRLGHANAAAQLAARLGSNWAYARANGNRWAITFEEGEAILSRYPLQDVSVHELKPQAGVFEHRIVLQALAQTADGPVAIFVTHLTNGDPEINRQQAAALQSLVAERRSYPAIVAGDFNARPGSQQMRALANAWGDAALLTPTATPFPTCCIADLRRGPDEALEKRIDYLFLVAGDAGTLQVEQISPAFATPQVLPDGWLWPSDHIGLAVVLSRGEANHAP